MRALSQMTSAPLRSCETRLRGQSSPCRAVHDARDARAAVCHACVEPGGDSLGPRLLVAYPPVTQECQTHLGVSILRVPETSYL